MFYETHKDCLNSEQAAVELGNLYDWLGSLTLKDVSKGVKLDLTIKIK